MTELHMRRGAARRSRLPWVVLAAALAALVAGAVVLTTRGSPPPPRSPVVSDRAVALGDSVPYGHGLHNPYPTSQIGLPSGWRSQGPAPVAYPSEVAHALGLTMTVRPTSCTLTGDQLAVSGAVADPADNTAADGQCPPQQARNLEEEVAAADLTTHPARLVFLQDGADDIDFASCLEYELARVAGVSLGLGAPCVENGTVTPALSRKLSDVRSSLARTIEAVAPHSAAVVVLDYYQPVPRPSQIADDAAAASGHTNLICAGLRANAASTSGAAQVVLTALNRAIAGAVSDARAAHDKNVTFVDVSGVLGDHGVCTADPWVFSGEPVPDATLAQDGAAVAAAATCDRLAIPCGALSASAIAAQKNLEGYVWRAIHPTTAGQRALAAAVEGRISRAHRATSPRTPPRPRAPRPR